MAERCPVTSCITTFRANTTCRGRKGATAIHEASWLTQSQCRGLPQMTCTRPPRGGPAWGSCHELSPRALPARWAGAWRDMAPQKDRRSQGEQGSLSWGNIPFFLLCPVSRVVFTECFTSNSIFFSKGRWHSFPTVSFCNPLPCLCPSVPWNRVQILLSFLHTDLPFLLCPVQGYNGRSFGWQKSSANALGISFWPPSPSPRQIMRMNRWMFVEPW